MTTRLVPDAWTVGELWAEAHRRLQSGGCASLDAAQGALAAEHGFWSWSALLQHLELEPNARARQQMTLWFAQAMPQGDAPSVRQLLEARLEVLLRAHRAGVPAASRVVQSQPGNGSDFADTARERLAREHGYRSWSDALEQGERRAVCPRFEAAADAVAFGDIGELRSLLGGDPSLARARSAFGHRATLLHYASANGIEAMRQWKSPRETVRDRSPPDRARCRSGRGLRHVRWRRGVDHAVPGRLVESSRAGGHPGRARGVALRRWSEARRHR